MEKDFPGQVKTCLFTFDIVKYVWEDSWTVQNGASSFNGPSRESGFSWNPATQATRAPGDWRLHCRMTLFLRRFAYYTSFA
jgi:hypothetical protein